MEAPHLRDFVFLPIVENVGKRRCVLDLRKVDIVSPITPTFAFTLTPPHPHIRARDLRKDPKP